MSCLQSNPAETIVVIGGGLIGSVAALALANGTEHRVVHVAPTDLVVDGRTTALLQDAVRVLSSIGVWTDAREFAAPLETMRLLDGTRRLLRAPPIDFVAGELGLEAFGYNLVNDDLVRLLARAIAAHPNIRTVPERAEGIDPTNDAVTVRTETESFDASIVVGAEGRTSPSRHAAGITTRDWRYDQVALVTTFTHSRPHANVSVELHTETGPFTQVPLPPAPDGTARSSLVWVVRTAEAADVQDLSAREQARIIEERFDHQFGEVSVERAPAAYPLTGLIADEAARGRIALVGEAAHVFPPIGAQGANLGFRDVTALVDSIGEHGHAVAALEAYARSRKADVTLRTAAVDVLNRSLLTDFLPVQAARSLGVGLLKGIGPLRRATMTLGMAPASAARSA